MRFKVDENLPDEVATLLRQAGYDAATVLDQQMGGDPDSNVAALRRVERRALITLDVGFAGIRNYPPEVYDGIIVLRLRRQDKRTLFAVVGRMSSVLKAERLAGTLWIVDEERVRVRT